MNATQKKTTAIDKTIAKHILGKDLIRVARTVKDGEKNARGFILGVSKELLLIQREVDFALDGYVILRRDQIGPIRCNKFDESGKKILMAEGILEKQLGLKKKIDLNSWKTVFENLKKFDLHATVECENLRKPQFVIGSIEQVAKDHAKLRNYDATGLLDDKLTTVKFKDITMVTFGDRYSTVFRRHLEVKIS